MNTEQIRKQISILEEYTKYLRLLNEEEEGVNIEVRVFTKEGWDKIDFKLENKSIRNMIIHQLRMEIQDKINTSKNSIKILTK